VWRSGRRLRFVVGEACQAGRQRGQVARMRLVDAEAPASQWGGLGAVVYTWLVAAGIVRWDLGGRWVVDRSRLATEGIAAWAHFASPL